VKNKLGLIFFVGLLLLLITGCTSSKGGDLVKKNSQESTAKQSLNLEGAKEIILEAEAYIKSVK